MIRHEISDSLSVSEFFAHIILRLDFFSTRYNLKIFLSFSMSQFYIQISLIFIGIKHKDHTKNACILFKYNIWCLIAALPFGYHCFPTTFRIYIVSQMAPVFYSRFISCSIRRQWVLKMGLYTYDSLCWSETMLDFYNVCWESGIQS